ncbi:homeobox-leucine zipper protein ATHB-4 isoform X2 [Eucalyptus grandis]|uniref:homeobox-leucine zipper protein ATHB-4 isoform X2 n=1 Tax=Eucalyptus grandis TaxID=71139 RepID=UPI00192E8632|nr:homeobox-leucine zipper protein ATHB-4 isoform X2 [Eucalyptus grandis]
MGEQDDGLGLSLSLGCGKSALSLNLNLVEAPVQSRQSPGQKCSWNEIFHSPETNSKTRPLFGGVGVNRDILVVDLDDDNHVSSPNSTVSSISGKRSERDPHGDNEVEAERTSCSCESIEEDGSGGDGARKKLRLSREQSLVLEETFKEHNTLNPCRTKTKQTEVDCEYLKRCCDNLTQENKRLQKEVQELRALKLSPQLYMHMNPPTTLTMCPSCQRVSVPSSSLSPPSSSSVTASVIGPVGPVHNPFSQSGPSINPWARLQMQQGLNNLHS